MAGPNRNKNFAIGALIALTLLIGVAIFLSVQAPAQLDPTSPEGAVQGYYQAVLDGDETKAFSYFTSDLRSKCLNEPALPVGTASDVRIVISNTDYAGSEAVVTVEIRDMNSGDPLFGGSYDFEERVVLQQSGARWLISQAPWPIWCNSD